MKANTYCIKMETTKAPEFVDITDGICRYVKDSEVQKRLCRSVLKAHDRCYKNQRERTPAPETT